MAECDYCGERFDSEEALLAHMGEAHEGELGRIDQRRVADQQEDGGGGIPTGPIAIALIVFLSSAVVAFVIFGGSDGGNAARASPVSLSGVSPSGIEAEPLPDSGDEQALSGVETFESEGADHVSAGTDVDYGTDPPTSGDHYPRPAPAGFYEETPPLGNLVHSLEHGHVVIYYDPAAISPGDRESLEEFAVVHDDSWAAVTVVPNPNDDPKAAYVLTAWRHMLTMDEYDAGTVRAFLAEYLGRGPENPVR